MEYSCAMSNSEGGLATLRTANTGGGGVALDREGRDRDMNIPPVIGEGNEVGGFVDGQGGGGGRESPSSPIVKLIKKKRDTTTAWKEQRPRQRNDKPAIRRTISSSHSSRQLMRQMSALGMVDPVFGTEEEEGVKHPSHIFDDMCFADIPEDMQDVISVASDHTATKDDGLDVAKFQDCLGVDSNNLQNSISNFSFNELSSGGANNHDKEKERSNSSLSQLDDLMEPEGNSDGAGAGAEKHSGISRQGSKRSHLHKKKLSDRMHSSCSAFSFSEPTKKEKGSGSICSKPKGKKQQLHPHPHDDWHASVTTLESLMSDPLDKSNHTKTSAALPPLVEKPPRAEKPPKVEKKSCSRKKLPAPPPPDPTPIPAAETSSPPKKTAKPPSEKSDRKNNINSSNHNHNNTRSHSPRKNRGVRPNSSVRSALPHPSSPPKKAPPSRTNSEAIPRSPRHHKQEESAPPRTTGKQRLLQAFNSPTKQMKEISLSGDMAFSNSHSPVNTTTSSVVAASPRKMPQSAADVFHDQAKVHQDISPGRQKAKMVLPRNLPLSPENLFSKSDAVASGGKKQQPQQSPPPKRQTVRSATPSQRKPREGPQEGLPPCNSEMFSQQQQQDTRRRTGSGNKPPSVTSASINNGRTSVSPKKLRRGEQQPSSSISSTNTGSTKASSVSKHREMPASPNDLFGGGGGENRGGGGGNGGGGGVNRAPPKRTLSPRKQRMPEDLFSSGGGPGSAPIRRRAPSPQKEHRELPSCPGDLFPSKKGRIGV